MGMYSATAAREKNELGVRLTEASSAAASERKQASHVRRVIWPCFGRLGALLFFAVTTALHHAAFHSL